MKINRIKKRWKICLAIVLIIIISIGVIVPIYWNEYDSISSKEKLIQTFDDKIPKLMRKYNVPGVSIGIIHNKEITDIKNYGYADKKTKSLINCNTYFQVGSISKSITAWGIMKLVEQGKLDLDIPIISYITRLKLPQSEFTQEITTRQLLSHTAGIAEQNYSGYKDLKKLPTLEQSLLGKASYVQPIKITAQPGTQYLYTGVGYTLLQLIIEEVSNTPFSKYMKDEVLDPLGMTKSTFDWDEQMQNNMARGYNLFGYPHDDRYFTEEAAAGLYTTVGDLSNFVLASIYDTNENRVISTDSLKLMHTSMIINNKAIGYGLGHNIFNMINGDKVITHNGMNIGWNSEYFVLPEKGEGIVILTNSEVGNLIISDIFSKWSNWQTGDKSVFYIRSKIMDGIYTIFAIFLLVILLIRLTFFISSIINKDKKFFLSVKDRKNLRIVIKMIIPIGFIIAWWFLLYFPWYKGGWTVATILPYEIIRVTCVVSAWSIYLTLKALFIKINKNTYVG